MAKDDVFDLLDELEELIDRGTKIPMTGKVMVDDRVVFDIIDRIRVSLPEEIQNAKWVLSERQKIMDEAQIEAQKMLEQGKNYIDKMAMENEIVKQAQSYAEDLARQAQLYAQEVKVGAIQYADEIIEQVEKNVIETVHALRQNREELRSLAKLEQREKVNDKVSENNE